MENNIFIRFAEKDDCKFLYRLRNDPLVRKLSNNTKKIAYKKHINWFKNCLKDTKRQIFIIFNSKMESAGQIRFDRAKNTAKVNIALDKNSRGKGFGAFILKKSCELYFNNYDVDVITAEIKKNNIPSLKIFKKAGFKIKNKNYLIDVELKKQKATS